MVQFDFSKDCYSCGACGDCCPVGAISYTQNLHPVVDKSKCVSCGLCQKVCIQQTPLKPVRSDWPETGYVLKNRDETARKNSSSGGVFIQLAQAVLAAGGWVCGCVYDDCQMPKHIVTNDFETCKKMMGSKYVKSDMSGCIATIKALTQAGHPVLFTGVPCQIAAVKRCVPGENLLTAAVVCHGSIERDVWQTYLKEEAPEGGITAVTMRDKSRGYLNYGLKFTFRDGTQRITYRNTDGYFLKSFTDGLFQRERCLHCTYKGHKICSDLLLGDAWGMDPYFPEFVDQQGCSAVLALTPAGEKLLQSVLDQFWVQTVQSKLLLDHNGRILTPAPVNPFRASFQRKLHRKGANLHRLTQRYAKVTLCNRIKWKLAAILYRNRS